jgi:hypothetical protein
MHNLMHEETHKGDTMNTPDFGDHDRTIADNNARIASAILEQGYFPLPPRSRMEILSLRRVPSSPASFTAIALGAPFAGVAAAGLERSL